MTQYKVEVFQPRTAGQFYDHDNDEVLNEDMFHGLREIRAGMVDPDDLTHEKFGRFYNLVGTDTVEGDTIQEALESVWARWNNGSGQECETFRESNGQRRAVSLSTGHVIRMNGTAYLCQPVGWDSVAALSFGGADE